MSRALDRISGNLPGAAVLLIFDGERSPAVRTRLRQYQGVGEGVTQDEIDSAVTYKLADRKSHPVAGSLVEVRAADRDWTIVRGRVVAWHDDVLTGSTRQLTISREQAVQ